MSQLYGITCNCRKINKKYYLCGYVSDKNSCSHRKCGGKCSAVASLMLSGNYRFPFKKISTN